jgi:hypothetical protein
MREPPPPYEGEGPFALWHYSEDPSLARFEPRPVADPAAPAVVWAIDTRHAPSFWVPRDCPRGCIWPGARTTAADREGFFGPTASGRLHVMESAWLDRLRACRLYAYRLPTSPFTRDQVGGYWTSREPVDALERITCGDLLARHAEARIELRVTPSIWPFWHRVIASTVEFSGSRLRNASPEPTHSSTPPMGS